MSPLILLALGFAEPAVSPAADADGVKVHTVRCEYQTGETTVRVLLPPDVKPGEKLPAVYVLPVEAKAESRYGDGLAEIRKQKLHEKYRAVYVAPSFAQLPWYADHPTDPGVRQESYFVKVVVPLVEKTYPVKPDRDSRLLLGFSKSGYGAVCLLLRHRDTFGRAAAWDAPLMLDKPGKYGSGPIYGTAENFERYRVAKLLETAKLGDAPRIALTGAANFRAEHVAAHELMEKWKVPHVYRDPPAVKHDWHSGWVAGAVAELIR